MSRSALAFGLALAAGPAAPCDERARVLKIHRVVPRYTKNAAGDAGLIPRVDLGGSAPWRNHILIADRIEVGGEGHATGDLTFEPGSILEPREARR